jgi:hypothetical protein
MKPPDSITDGVVVLRKMREDDRAVFFRFESGPLNKRPSVRGHRRDGPRGGGRGGPLNQPARRVTLRVGASAVDEAA